MESSKLSKRNEDYSKLFVGALGFFSGIMFNRHFSSKNQIKKNFGDLNLSIPFGICLSCAFETFKSSLNYVKVEKIDHILSKALTSTFVDKIRSQVTRSCTLEVDSNRYTFYCTDVDVEKDIRECIEITLFLKRLSNKSVSLTYHIFMIDFPKVYDGSSKLSSYDNINSGMYESSIVYVWRLEECVKVTCHETIHALGLDFYNESLYLYRLKIDLGWRIDGPFNPAEATTEALTRILTCIYLANKNNVSIEDLLQYQFRFTIKNAAKILKLNKIKNISSLKNNNWEQQTYAIEYYLLTAVLLYDCCVNEKIYEAIFSRILQNGQCDPSIISNSILRNLRTGSNFCNIIDTLLTYEVFDNSLRMTPF